MNALVAEEGKANLASVLYECCGLAPKCYSLRQLNGADSVTAKGVTGVLRTGLPGVHSPAESNRNSGGTAPKESNQRVLNLKVNETS